MGLRLALGGGGKPFDHLPEPGATEERERRARAQAAPAIRLYRVLLQRTSPERALVVAGKVIEAGAVSFLAKTLGELDSAGFAALESGERTRRVQGWIDRFFTATATLDHVGANEVDFTVSACALVRLCQEAGHPELAPAFCRGDALFFASQRPPIALTRETTLAEGGPGCPFRLRLPEA